MNPDWVDNVGYSLRVDRLREMSAAEVDNMLTQMQEEMLHLVVLDKQELYGVIFVS